LNNKKFLSRLVIAFLIVSAFPLFVQVGSENASAAPDTHTWDGGGADASAGTKENWVTNISPEAGDSVVFNAGALPCTWNLTAAFASFAISAAYTGTITQAASFSVTSFTMSAAGATFTGARWNKLNDSGSFTHSAGTISSITLLLIMSGDGTTLISNTIFDVLEIFANVTAGSNLHVNAFFTIGVGKTFTLGTYELIDDGLQSWNNQGIISGTGTLVSAMRWASISRTYGTLVGCPVSILMQAASGGDYTMTLSADTVLPSTLRIGSNDLAHTVTLDLSASNYALSATDITIGTRGILMGRASAITSSGNMDFANGTFYQNTSSVLMNGGGYVVIAADQQFHNLTINGTDSRLFVATGDSMRVANNLTVNSGCSASLQNHSYVMTSLVNNGAITQNGKRLNITGSSTTPLTGYGTFDGDLYLNGSSASSYEIQTGLPMGNLYFDRDTKIGLDSTRYLQVVPASTEFVDVSIKSIGTEQGYAARWTATSTGPVTYTVTANSNELYDIWVDHTTRIGVVQTSSDGVVQFTYNGPFSTHEFTVSKSGGPPTSLGASFSYSISGNQVSFTDKSYGGVSMWVWDFGDGTGSTNQNPVHKYAKSGDYTISLTVYDSSGHSSTAKTTITLKLGPQFPVEPTPKGWNVWVSDKLTVSVSALALLIFGTWFLLAGYFPPLLPLMTPKTKKILGLIIIAIGLYWFVFVDNSHSWLGWGSV